MKWILFTGTWRLTNSEIENDVRTKTREVLSLGYGIVTGRATGVDYFAMDEAMKIYPDASRLIVVIPAYLKSYIYDYKTNWLESPVTEADIDNIEKLLRKIKRVNKKALIEIPNDIIDQSHYNERHEEEVRLSDEVYAFQVNDSTGTQDTINRAVKKGLPLTFYKKYII